MPLNKETNKLFFKESVRSRTDSFFAYGKKSLSFILALGFWILLWYLLAKRINSNLIIAAPDAVLMKLCQLAQEKSFYLTLLNSCGKIIAAFLLAGSVGFVLAFFAACFSWIEKLIYPWMAMLRAAPVASLIILLFFFFSSRYLSLIVAFMMVLPILYGSSLSAIRHRRPELEELAKVYQVSLWLRIRDLYFIQFLPFLLPAWENALGFSFKAAIATELIVAASQTIGDELYRAKIYLDTESLFAWTLISILLSVFFEKGFKFLLRKICRRLFRDGSETA